MPTDVAETALPPSSPSAAPTPAGEVTADAHRIRVLLRVLAVATLCGFFLSPKLWLTERGYPLAPVWSGLPPIPSPWDRNLFAGLVLLLVVIAAVPRFGRVSLAFVTLAGLLCLWDQTRWQPWFYQYLGMFAVLGSALRGGDPERRTGLNACRLIVAATYFWSGLQKANVTFQTNIHPFLVAPLLPLLPEPWQTAALDAGRYVPVLEAGVGLALLLRPTRLPASLLALGMHAFILGVLGPWGHDWNSVVWPWNAAMMLFVPTLFWTRDIDSPWRVLAPGRLPAAWVTALLFGVMPAFGLFGLWDAYLSISLYSGNTPRARAFIDRSVFDALPPHVREKHALPTDGEGHLPGPAYRVDFFNWAIDELNVPAYPARRVYRSLARSLSTAPQPPGSVVLVYEGPPNRRTAERPQSVERFGPP